MMPLDIRKSFKVAFSPQSERLATLSRDVFMWNVSTKRKILRAHPLPHPAYCSFSPSGKELAVKGTSGQIVTIDSKAGKVLCDFDNSGDGEGANLLYSPCGDYIVDGSWAGQVFVRRTQSGEIEYVREFPDEMIKAAHHSDQGRTWLFQHVPKAKKSGHSRANLFLHLALAFADIQNPHHSSRDANSPCRLLRNCRERRIAGPGLWGSPRKRWRFSRLPMESTQQGQTFRLEAPGAP